MTTLKPQLIRADTLDLQTQDSPSAKDHTRQPAHPSPVGLGPAAPHQNQALRNAEQDALQEQMKSPRVAHHPDQSEFAEDPDFYDDQDDEAQDGLQTRDGQAASQVTDDSGIDDSDIGDQGDDDGLDDDLMDKISSSPSIDDGNYPLSILWPSRVDSVESGVALSPLSALLRGEARCSSSPYDSTPEHYPIRFCTRAESTSCSHYHGKYPGATLESPVKSSSLSPNFEQLRFPDLARFQETKDEEDAYEESLSIDDLNHFLIPLDDPLLGGDEENEEDECFFKDSNADDPDWEDDDEVEAQKGGSSSDDDSSNLSFTNDSRFIDSGWGGECLREVEDIDFEFVYALHTFVATVEGQANATKGDTMVLLDDSNSYWWLVRVVKDGSIGYLPAEHIETPTERLARLNKHRNIDLSATMLGDNPEKSKNPLKKAMRRRNAKTVQFAPPQYFEPSDFEYSDEEEGMEGEYEEDEGSASANTHDISKGEDGDADEDATTIAKSEQNGPVANGVQILNTNDNAYGENPSGSKKRRASDEAFQEDLQEESEARSRRELVRNSDSFFKDDGVETKKISLTPRLLRGDSDVNLPGQQADLKAKGSLETFDRLVSPDSEKSGDEKKKKEKKGMLGGLFKRKEKKGKSQDNDSEDGKKGSDELSRASPLSKKSSESLAQDARHGKGEKAPQRQTSKLQKQPPPQMSPKHSPTKDSPRAVIPSPHLSIDSAITPSPHDSLLTPSTLRSPMAEAPKGQESMSPRIGSPEAPPERATSPNEKRPTFPPISDALKPAGVRSSDKGLPAEDQQRAVKPAVNRFDIDDLESENDDTPPPTNKSEPARQMPPAVVTHHVEPQRERLSHSPIEVSPLEPPESQKSSSASQPPMLIVDTSSSNSERRSISPISPTSSSSPSLVDVDAETPNDAEESTNPSATSPHADAPTPSTSRSTPTWSDASLRSYMDNDDDIRDLLIIVHDKSNVIPAGPEHPITGHLFGAEKGRLAEMQSNLDSMLTSWLARKNQTRLSR